jgi:hypothetical protein
VSDKGRYQGPFPKLVSVGSHDRVFSEVDFGLRVSSCIGVQRATVEQADIHSLDDKYGSDCPRCYGRVTGHEGACEACQKRAETSAGQSRACQAIRQAYRRLRPMRLSMCIDMSACLAIPL